MTGVVQTKAATTGATSVTFDSTTTTGNSIVVLVWAYGATDLGTTDVTDNKGNTYTRRFVEDNAGGETNVAIYDCQAPTMGASHQVNLSSHTDQGLCAIEVNGLTGSPAFDKSGGTHVLSGSAGSAPTTASTGTLTQADELVVGVVCTDQGNSDTITPNAGQSWTQIAENEAGASNFCFNAVHKTVAATTALTGVWALGGSHVYAACIGTYKLSAGGDATATPGVVSPVLTIPAPTIHADAAITLSTVSPALSIPAPTISIPPVVVASGGAAITTSRSPSITFGSYTPATNDLVIFWASSTTTGHTMTEPAEWVNPLGAGVDVESDVHQLACAYHFVTAAEATAVTTTYTATNWYGATHTGYVQGAVVRYADTTTPIDSANSTFSTTNTVTPHVLASLTGTNLSTGSLVMSSVAKDGTGDYGASAPGGWTRLRNDNTNQGRWIGTRDALTTVNVDVTATNITPSAGDEYASITVAITAAPPATVVAVGVVSPTLTIPVPTISADVTLTLSTVSPSLTAPAPTISVGVNAEVTPATVNPVLTIPTPTVAAAANVTAAVVSPVLTIPTPTITTLAAFWPTTISGRKILDQNGDVYLYKTMSSWGMYRLSDADITTALEGCAANGFNGVTVWMGGGYRLDTSWQVSSSYYKNSAGANFWSGTPWASSLGSGWSTYDWIVSEAERLGITVTLSLPCAFGSTGARADMEAATNTNMYDAGVAIATRYLSAPNVVWHAMLDDNGSPSDTIGLRIEAFFDGVNDTEGASTRPFRWMEPNNGNSTNEQGWLGTTQFNVTVNCIYEYGSNSVELFEAGYTESGATSGPAGDTEPPYDGSPHYSGNLGQQLRERTLAVFIEGGSLINYGQENWWPFGANGLYDEGLTWQDVQAHDHTVQQSYIHTLIDTYVAATDWAPTSGFVTTGEGSGDTKAAQGAKSNVALAYFPSSRTVVVDTTIIMGTGLVDLSWWDPIDGTFTSIATGEAQQTGRSVTYPSAHADTTNDWVLVVEGEPVTEVTPTTVQPVLTIPTPVISAGVAITPAVVQPTLSIPAPSISAGVSITPSVVQPTLSIPAPAISAGVTITANAVSLSLTVPAPAISAGVTIILSTVSPTLTIPDPTVAGGAVAAPSAVSPPLSIPAPSISADVTITSALVAPTLSVPTPTISAGVTLTLATVSPVLTVPDPSISAGVTVTLTTVQPTLTIPSPSISAGGSATVSVNTVSLSLTIPIPSIAVSAAIDVTVVGLTLTIPSLTISAGVSITIGVISLTLTIPTPTIDASSGTTATPGVISLALTTPAPAISAGATITVGVISLVLSIPSASVVVAANVALPTISPALVIPVPAISTGIDVVVTPSTVQPALSLPAPTVAADMSVAVAVVALVLAILSPSVSAVSPVTFTTYHSITRYSRPAMRAYVSGG